MAAGGDLPSDQQRQRTLHYRDAATVHFRLNQDRCMVVSQANLRTAQGGVMDA